MNNPTLKTFTNAELIAKRNEQKINTEMQIQRPVVSAWTKEKRLNALKDSILKNWSIGVLQAIIDEDGTINLIDGKQRITAIMSIADNDLPMMTPEQQAQFKAYRVVVVDNAPMKMSDEEQAEFFVRLNSGGVALTSAQVMRGKYSASLLLNAKAINNIKDAMAISKQDAEKAFIMAKSADANQYDYTKNLYNWYAENQAKTAIDNTKRAKAYQTVINHMDESAQKRANRLIHQVMIYNTLTGNETEKDLLDYGSRLNAFFNSNSGDSDNRKQYNNACHSATGDSGNVKLRYDTLMDIKTAKTAPTTTNKKIKDDEQKLKDDQEHAKREQEKADANAKAKADADAIRQKAIDDAIAQGKASAPNNAFNKHNKKH